MLNLDDSAMVRKQVIQGRQHAVVIAMGLEHDPFTLVLLFCDDAVLPWPVGKRQALTIDGRVGEQGGAI